MLKPFSPLKQYLLLPLLLVLAFVGFINWQALPSLSNAPAKQSSVTDSLKIPADQSIYFVMMGDWGSGLKPQYEVGEALFKKYQQRPFDFLVTLGDNIYPLGDIKDGFEKKYALPYEKLLKTQMPWFVALGNHDAPKAKEQVAFFKMPARYYTFTQGPVQFFVLDTNIFYPLQQQWLENQLKASKARWKIVVGHHPAYSTGKHGNNKHLIETLVPILESYKADAYITGHDHGYERFNKINGVQYIISGGGGASIREFEFDGMMAESLVRISDYHFLVVDANWREFKIEAIDRNLNNVDTITLTKN